jgi:phospholipid/cholesterol/gamma-HCH transport system ATP-binding protein
MIEVKNIEKSFGESKILKGISTVLKLENQSYHWTKWIWKNGFIKSLLGIHRPEEGTIEFDGRKYGNLDDEEKTPYRNRNGFSRQCLI